MCMGIIASFDGRRRRRTRSEPVGNAKSGGGRIMQGLTRGAMTLFGVVVAGFLIWWGASALPSEGDASLGEFWWAAALIAAAGLIMALSQLLGGWTKWGWPRVSGNVFLLGFLPALIAGGWVVAAAEAGDHWLRSPPRGWAHALRIGEPPRRPDEGLARGRIRRGPRVRTHVRHDRPEDGAGPTQAPRDPGGRWTTRVQARARGPGRPPTREARGRGAAAPRSTARGRASARGIGGFTRSRQIAGAAAHSR